DTATNTVITTVPVGDAPTEVAVTPDGTRAYVVNSDSDNVSVIDTATNTVITTVPVGDAPTEVAVTPDGTRAYVTNSGSDNVSVIDTATNTVVDTVTVGDAPSGIAVTPDGSRVYVANFDSNDVSVIDTATNTVITTVPVGVNADDVAVTPDGSRVYVTNFGSNDVSVIDTATNTVITTVPVGVNPDDVAIGTVAPDRTPTRLTLKVEKKKKGKDTVSALGGKDGLTLTARLTAGGQSLEGESIDFTADSVLLCSDTTDSRGRATCQISRQKDKDTCYTAIFDGDETYEPATATVCRDDHDSTSKQHEVSNLSDLAQAAMTSAGSHG
ncbi:YncE family protein, partial [Streptomyces sp. NPDC049597]|uniref:YncE family protein n=1 Tax=Streptomyces sp. NPDC049597 TaxID=3155276 RepID=UPI003433DD65